MNAVLLSTRAELMRLRKWPAVWVTTGTFLVLNLLFGYVFNYVAYRSGDTGGVTDGASPQALVADVMPQAVPESVYSGMPMFGGALMLILGALTVGSGYAWGTWKTVYTQGPTRLTAGAGTILALAAAVVGVVAATFVVDLSVSLVLATVESQPIVWPTVGAVAEGLGGGAFILGMWTVAGVFLGTFARGPALAAGLGLVWVLVVENLLRGVAAIWSPIERLTDLLPGTAAGSLAGALGATPVSEPSGTPGVLTVLDGATAVWLMAAYVVAFVAVSAALVQRRDVT